jgi:glycogen debranching enzyme
MSDEWAESGESAPIGHAGTVTLVEGRSFCLSGRSGEIRQGTPDGLFFLEARFLSRVQLRINGASVEPLAVATDHPFAATFLGRAGGEHGLVVIRNRWVGFGMREDLTIRNYQQEPQEAEVELSMEVDFADLFDVKASRRGPPVELVRKWEDSRLTVEGKAGRIRRKAVVTFSERPEPSEEQPAWRVTVPARGEWRLCWDLVGSVNGAEVEPRYRCGQSVERSKPVERLTRWRRTVPEVDTDHAALSGAVRKAAEDLGALRIFDPEFPDRPILAAGAPWFMTVFGRDSLITAWLALIVDPELSKGALQTLVRFQGKRVDEESEEEPGRILHEMRFQATASRSLSEGSVYYGSIDSTPLFVMLVGELRRWGIGEDVVLSLLPAVQKALGWIEEFGDRDGDGFVEYQRASEGGLENQGWKDSYDGIRGARGEFPEGPIALCEVQAYVYGAYVAAAHFAREAGDGPAFEKYQEKARAIREAFNRDFWLEDRGYFALGLDGDKRPIDSLASNMGHALWTGIVDADKAPAVARCLMSPEMFSGWGVRTLATNMAHYDPLSYHNGSVWPHDNALIAAGLMRYGFIEEAQRIIEGMLAAAAAHGGRLPELFSGFDRGEVSQPAEYPTSSRPQAWAAATPLMFLRTLLRLDPWHPESTLWISPVPLPSMAWLRVEGIPIGDNRVTVRVEGDEFEVEGLPEDYQVIREPRAPLGATSFPPTNSSDEN